MIRFSCLFCLFLISFTSANAQQLKLIPDGYRKGKRVYTDEEEIKFLFRKYPKVLNAYKYSVSDSGAENKLILGGAASLLAIGTLFYDRINPESRGYLAVAVTTLSMVSVLRSNTVYQKKKLAKQRAADIYNVEKDLSISKYEIELYLGVSMNGLGLVVRL